MIKTRRLDLVTANFKALESKLLGSPELASVPQLAVPESWPPELYNRPAVKYTLDRLRKYPEEKSWWLCYFVLRGKKVLIGAGGFKGAPTNKGMVEIDYFILPAYRIDEKDMQ